MAIISNLVARLTCESKGFISGTKRAEKSMRAMQRESLRLQKSIRNLAGAYLGARGINSAIRKMRQEMLGIDRIAKMSDELNIGTRALTGWGHAAELSGTNLDTLHKGLQIFVRRIGEAQQGLGEARHGLKALGVSAHDLSAMGPEKAFVEMADAIGKIPDAASRAQAAYSLFGRQGVNLTNLFLQGKKGIAGMVEEADRLGLAFGRLDAAQVEAANDALTRARASAKGLATTIAIDLAPYTESLAEQFTNAMVSGQGFADNLVDGFEAAAIGAAKAKEAIESVVGVMGKLSPGGFLKKDILMTQAAKVAQGKYRYRMEKTGTPDPKAFTLKGPISASIYGKSLFGEHQPKNRALYEEILAQQKAIYNSVTTTAIESEAVGKIRETFKQLREQANKRRADRQFQTVAMMATRWLGEGTEWPAMAPGETDSGGKDLAKAAEKATTDIAAAYRRMFSDMKRMSEESWEVRRQLLDKERAEYEKHIKDKALIDKWYNEQRDTLAIDEARSGSDFLAGMGASLREAQKEMKSFGQMGYEVGNEIREGLGGALNDALWRVNSLEEGIEQVARSAAMNFTGNLINSGMTSAFNAGGSILASFLHAGGDVGTGGIQKRVPAAAFINAPKFHNGGDVPAWLERGERVQSRAQVAAGDRNSAAVLTELQAIRGLLTSDRSLTLIDARDHDEILNQWAASPAGRRALSDAMAGVG